MTNDFLEKMSDYNLSLLQDSELAIEEVAGQSGFNSITSFRKYFRNVFGCSASEYKKRHASGQSVQNTDA